MATALIDADVLVYEIGFGAQDYETGEALPFSIVLERLEKKILDIKDGACADKYRLFLTGKGNFREDIAKTKQYKGNRVAQKPFHYDNIRNVLIAWGAEVVDGMEADDMMAIIQTESVRRGESCKEDKTKGTCICTRDKDLLQVEGWHYRWELGKQAEMPKHWVDKIGKLELDGNKLKGEGLKFFYAQCIMGDTVDNIPGLPRKGPAFAYKVLKDCATEDEMLEAVISSYEETLEVDRDEAIARLTEQAQLLWMVRELDDEGNPVMWRVKND